MDKYREIVKKYYLDIKNRNLKEEPRREKFLSLLKDLFPNSIDEIQKYTDGAEKSVKIQGSGKEFIKNGRIDAYFGDLIIEFERAIPQKRDEAESQLREYCSGLWNIETDKRPYICIATDGLNWISYFPYTSKNKNIGPEDISLTEKENIFLTDDPKTYDTFFLFINRVFFREGRIKPTIENFKKDFGLGSYLFEGIQKELLKVFESIRNEEEIELSYSEWSRYLTYTYGSVSTNEFLFCKHTYLSVLARFIVWAALTEVENEPATTSFELISSLLTGNYFERIGILNLAEKDFFHWIGDTKILSKLEVVWLKVLNQLKTYEFKEIHEDLLKGVYQELVDPSDRHDLGEYYTPDWLCEKIANYLIKKKKVGIPSVIDLTCGSGSFLRAAIHRIQELILSKFREESVNWESVLTAILNNVNGIDIHPLAVIISKANYVLAIKDLLKYRKKPIQLPIFLADSLFMPQTEELVLFEERNTILSFCGEKYIFPQSFFANSQTYDNAIFLTSNAAKNLVKDNTAETEAGFYNSVKKIFKHLSNEGELNTISKELFRLAKHLAEKIIKKENTIWSFILRNNYKPVFLQNKYDVIIGNPPWLSYRYISDINYQNEIKNLGVKEYGVAPEKQKLITQMEIATIFFVHATNNYLKRDGILGFVMPRSVFNGDQHEKFRAESYKAECDIMEYWDLEDVSPLFNVPSCVIFSKRKKKPSPNEYYKTLFLSGRLPEKDLPLSKVDEIIKEKVGRLYLSRIGERTALSKKKIDYEESVLYYKDRFFQGATIVPRNFYFIKTPDAYELNAEEFYAKTDPEQAKEGKPPYKDIFLEGTVETGFIFRTALSKHVLPFYIGELPYILLPVLKEDREYKLKTAQELRNQGYRKIANWFFRAENEWNKHRGAKADRQDLYQRLNYHNELMKQNPDLDYIVLYNTSGKNIVSAVLDLKKIDRPFFADAKTYWLSVHSVNEGYYLLSILNSEIINEIIKPFQSKGLLGERDIHKKVLEIPIPQFDKKNDIHNQLAISGKEATERVAEIVKAGKLSGTLAKKRGKVRELLSKELKEIALLVQSILS